VIFVRKWESITQQPSIHSNSPGQGSTLENYSRCLMYTVFERSWSGF
jgi:hypothetical protein